MAYQRAQWHSGFIYHQVCETCNTAFQYTDYVLDFRPWYPDGYVDCPKCKSHLRHNEKYAINSVETSDSTDTPSAEETTAMAAFCSACGHKFSANDRFCAMCGAKRT